MSFEQCAPNRADEHGVTETNTGLVQPGDDRGGGHAECFCRVLAVHIK